MKLRFTVKSPEIGYSSNNLILPKSVLNVDPIKAALTFIIGEEEIFDEDGTPLLTSPKTLELWDDTRHHLVVPREFISREDRSKLKFDIIDEIANFPYAEIEDRICLRPEQEEPLKALLRNHSGTLNLACGKGKSVLALKLAAELKVPTLIIVNTSALLEQWKLAISEHLKVSSVGHIQGKLNDWKHPITVAMLHTLSDIAKKVLWTSEMRRWFGLIIYDEGHHMSAPVFVQSADLFYGRRFSLTATASRTDGLESIYQYHLGRVIYRDLEQSLIPAAYVHRLKWEMPLGDKSRITDSLGEINLSKVRSYLGSIKWRNRLICEDINKDLSEGRNLLVLSHSVKHVTELYKMFEDSGGGEIIGSTPQEKRMSILKNSNPVFGSFSLAREGLDKKELDTLYITTPFSNENDAQQAVGRIQRICENKKPPIVRVYEDLGIGCCVKTIRRLKRILSDFGCPVRVKKINLERYCG